MTALRLYDTLPTWERKTIPKALLEKYQTTEGTWSKLTILSGELQCDFLDDEGNSVERHLFNPDSEVPFISPQTWYKLTTLTDDTQLSLSFYCQAEDYISKKYQTQPHSEVKEAAPILAKENILDLGCGHGRNSLFLANKGSQVTALDLNQDGLEHLKTIAETEDLAITVNSYDINSAKLTESYDSIISTVVFMFLDPDRIPSIIKNMQEQTKIGGHHLIVSAMDTKDYPCPMPFSFTFKEGELKHYYKDWEIIKYNENLGNLHRLDLFGNPIRMKFATLLAKKIK